MVRYWKPGKVVRKSSQKPPISAQSWGCPASSARKKGLGVSREREGTRYTDEVLSLDIRELVRQGAISTITKGVITWSRDGKAFASVGFAIDQSAVNPVLVLTYERGVAGTDPAPAQDRFVLETTPCHYGGERWWLRCRACGERVAVVYVARTDHRFVCRHCARLAYRSTRIGELDRIDRRRFRLARRLGYLPSYPRETIHWRHLPRPARMREATYQRLVDEGRALEQRASELWIDQVCATLSRADRIIARGYARLGWI